MSPTDWRGCKVVEVVPNKVGGVHVIRGTRVAADQVVENHDAGETVEDIAYNFDLKPEDIRALLAFTLMQTQTRKTEIDWSDCPIVETNPRKVSGAAILKGTRVQADSIVENYIGGSPVEEISENFGIPETTIRELLTFAAFQQNQQ